MLIPWSGGIDSSVVLYDALLWWNGKVNENLEWYGHDERPHERYKFSREDGAPRAVVFECNQIDSKQEEMQEIARSKLINDLYDFVRLIPTCEFDGIEKNYDHIIFEGAQGLRLDQNSPDFPHVTYSNTGLNNVLELLDKDRHELAVWYVTRPYLTRHGAGPLNNECFYDIIDETNKPNDYQGNLRFAPLDLGEFKTFVNKDYLKSDGFISTKHLSITCCDQVNDPNIEHIANSILANKVITCWSADGHWNLIEFPAESCI